MLADVGEYTKKHFTYNEGMTQVAVGAQIFQYEVVGKPGKLSPVVILHGWGRGGQEWAPVAAKINKWTGRQVYVLDLPGFGGSSLPTVDSIEEYTQLCRKFCEYLELQRVILIGHSLGGRVGIVLGASSPTLLTKLILVDPAGIKPKSLRRGVLQTLAKIFAWIPRGWRRALIAPFMDEDYHNSPALRELYRVVVAQDLRRYLPMVMCPTTLVWGERDPILPLSLTKTYCGLLPDCRVRVVWGAGHDPHLTKADQTVAILEEATE